MSLQVLIETLNAFYAERDWQKFHSPKNLCISLNNHLFFTVINCCRPQQGFINMKSRLFLCLCFVISANATVASNIVVTDYPRLCFPAARKPRISVDSLGAMEDIPPRWIKKNPIAEHEFSDPIKAEKDRNLLDPGVFGGYHRAVVNNREYWVIAVSEIEVISITTKPFTRIHLKVLYMGSWREITASEYEYKRLLCECMNLDI